VDQWRGIAFLGAFDIVIAGFGVGIVIMGVADMKVVSV
jgi:hypothetical protein